MDVAKIYDGKYTYRVEGNSNTWEILLHGEPWGERVFSERFGQVHLALFSELLELRMKLAQNDLAPEYCVHCGSDIKEKGNVSYGAGNGLGQKFQCEECYKRNKK